MMKNLNPPKLVLHTDIILRHLCAPAKEISVMRQVLSTHFCYTTVFNAIELFALAKTERERTNIESAMSCIKILGLNAKSAPKYGALFDTVQLERMNGLIAGLCLESKLPILTGKPFEFRKVKGLTVLTPDDILHNQQK